MAHMKHPRQSPTSSPPGELKCTGGCMLEPSGRGWERCGTSTWSWNYIALHYSEISPEIKVLGPSSAAIVDVVSMMSGRCGGMGATSQPCQSTTAELSYNTMCISYYLMKLVTNMCLELIEARGCTFPR
ncbi:hypothetical protein ZWY2020_032719 [Hordeum vulgare]|nr:hypothetical protein ZWY2020_032719 [Hordeum vulgare]